MMKTQGEKKGISLNHDVNPQSLMVRFKSAHFDPGGTTGSDGSCVQRGFMNVKYINTRRLLKLLSPECSILESMMVKSPFLSSPCLYSHVDRNTSFLDPLCSAWQSLVLVRGRKIVPPISSSTSWRAIKTVYRGATSVNWVSGWIYRKGEVIRERNGSIESLLMLMNMMI